MRHVRWVYLMLVMALAVMALPMGAQAIANTSGTAYDVDTGQAVLMTTDGVSDQAQIIGHDRPVAQSMVVCDVGSEFSATTQTDQKMAPNNLATARNGTLLDEESSFGQPIINSVGTTHPGNGGFDGVIKWNADATSGSPNTIVEHAVSVPQRE